MSMSCQCSRRRRYGRRSVADRGRTPCTSDDPFRRALINMKNSINNLSLSDKNYILNFEPHEEDGYAWDQDENYQRIENILSTETDSDGHSGASFAICLRFAIKELKCLPIVQSTEVVPSTEDSNLVTLEPI